MNWEKFKDQFHESWHAKIRPFIESEECDKIYEFLKKESKRGKKIAPLSPNVFRAFRETSLDDLKVVLMGMCPYHTVRDGNPDRRPMLDIAEALEAGELVEAEVPEWAVITISHYPDEEEA